MEKLNVPKKYEKYKEAIEFLRGGDVKKNYAELKAKGLI